MSTTYTHEFHSFRGPRPGKRSRGRYVDGPLGVQMSQDPNDPADGDAAGRREGRGSRGGKSRRGGPGFGPGHDHGHGRGFGPGGPGFGRRGGGRRGGRGGRGDVRAAILLLLETQPMHGYELIQQIGDKSGGVWTPSPGSIYPALQQLEDEGLIAFDRVEGRKTATLTDQGKAYVEEHRSELGSPWDDVSGGVSNEARDLHELIGTLMGAVHTVTRAGTPDQVRAASEVLAQARRSLYRILAGDDPQGGPAGSSEDDATS